MLAAGLALGIWDLIVVLGFLAVVVGVSLWAGRKEGSSEDYFLAGRKLTWGLIGFSLIASNISTEHFVGMAGKGFSRGLAVAGFEWIAVVTLVITALWLLPKFLKAGIYTMPQYLEYRYKSSTRTIMSVYLMVLTVVAVLVTVVYSGARGIDKVFDFSSTIARWFNLPVDHPNEEIAQAAKQTAVFWATWAGAWMIGIVAATYTIYGGLRSVVWSDLLQGGALLLGGAVALFLGLKLVGGGELSDLGVSGGSVVKGWSNFKAANADKLHAVMPWDDPEIPWIAIFTGLLIPNFFYWGLNQFITQRTLGAKSLAEGQKGIFLACLFKLIMPFIIIMPGIIAFQMFGDAIMAEAGGDPSKAGEIAYPHLIVKIMPPVLRGVVLAALAGAVMSTFNSGINSAATMYTVDVHKKFINTDMTPRQEVFTGRIATAIIAFAACVMAPLPFMFQGVFTYIQEIWGFISPAIVAAFFFGLLVPKAPTKCGNVALLLGPVIYAFSRVPGWIMGGMGYEMNTAGEVIKNAGYAAPVVITGVPSLLFKYTQWPYLHHMFITLILICIVLTIMTIRNPLKESRTMPTSKLDLRPHPLRYVFGGGLILAVVALYLIFW